MTDSRMVYERSNMPTKQGAPTLPREYSGEGEGPISGPDRDNLTFPSLASQGLIEIELPLRDSSGMEKVEKVTMAHFGKHVSKKIENALTRSGSSEAVNVLGWYTGCCAGGKLLSDKDQDTMQKLTRAFSGASDPGEFFVDEIEPFLSGLRPGQR